MSVGVDSQCAATVMNFFHHRCLSRRASAGKEEEKERMYFSFLLQLDYNNSHSSHLSFKFPLHVISTPIGFMSKQDGALIWAAVRFM